MELLLSTDQPESPKLIAQQDIVFSNSPIEAVNKIRERLFAPHEATRHCRHHSGYSMGP
ncbi:MAG: hypothetical protein IPJ85_04165 [Flavobacteriales bacterium]|nr:hypothetical protein [Flavobacteriales bacterium]